MKRLVFVLTILVLADWALTVDSIELGWAREANPLLFGTPGWEVLLIKMLACTALFCLVCYRQWKHEGFTRLINVLLHGALVAYLAIVTYQSLARLWYI